MDRANQASLVGVVLDRLDVDGLPRTLQGKRSAGNGQLADATVAQTSADDDPFGVAPCLQLEQAFEHARELGGELFDGALNDGGSFCVALHQNLVELLLTELGSGRVAEGIVSDLT